MRKLQTQRLILREWKLSDAQDMFDYAKHEEVALSAGWFPHKNIEESISQILNFIERDNSWAIELQDEKKVIGCIALEEREFDPDDDKKHYEIGFVLNSQYWGKGFIPEAVNAVIKHGFNFWKLNEIWVGHYDDNLKSKRVVEKCNFKYRFEKRITVKKLNNKKATKIYYSIKNESSQMDQRILALNVFKMKFEDNMPYGGTEVKEMADRLIKLIEMGFPLEHLGEDHITI